MDSESSNMVFPRQNPQAPSGSDQFLKLVQDPFAVSVRSTTGFVAIEEGTSKLIAITVASSQRFLGFPWHLHRSHRSYSHTLLPSSTAQFSGIRAKTPICGRETDAPTLGQGILRLDHSTHEDTRGSTHREGRIGCYRILKIYKTMPEFVLGAKCRRMWGHHSNEYCEQ